METKAEPVADDSSEKRLRCKQCGEQFSVTVTRGSDELAVECPRCGDKGHLGVFWPVGTDVPALVFRESSEIVSAWAN